MMYLLACIALFALAKHGDAVTAEDPCSEALDAGPCKYFQVQWYWDAEVEQCRKFHYGGCMGTKNRFGSKQDCLKQCVYKLHNPVAIPELCLLNKDPGYCGDDRVGLWWWHYNAEIGECEKFYYYGCGGNSNRFYSLHYCKKACGDKLSPQLACDRCDSRTSRCVSHSKYNYTCECLPGFEKNHHGDCAVLVALEKAVGSGERSTYSAVEELATQGIDVRSPRYDGMPSTTLVPDIDECRTYQAKCDPNSWCINTIGSYRCECMAGYREGKNKQCHYTGMGSPTLDCHKCDPQATCASGVCQCKIGFRGDGMSCTDINECLDSPYPCDKQATCHNTAGSFICKCREGFAGNGFVCSDSSRSCLDPWHRGYEAECAEGVWQERYYYNPDTKACSLFWYSGCNATSKNMFPSLQTCTHMCEKSHVLERARVCWDTFDPHAAEQCAHGSWEQRFYFDSASLSCRMFWHDGCTGNSRNVFTDLLTCQWLCEVQPMYKSKACLEPFDEHYKDQCEGGRWRQFHYYDREQRLCKAFWFDGCRSQNQNIFTNYETCQSTCEDHRFLDPMVPTPSLTTHNKTGVDPEQFACEPNPCMNGGQCKAKGHASLDYTCECARGFTDARCTTPPEHPCQSDPCKNGGSCVETTRPRVMFKCTCPSGYFGPYCDPNPCLSNPCVNDGTCRTMKGFSTFFCECSARYSGSRCQFDRWENKVIHFPDESQQESEWIDRLSGNGTGDFARTPPPGTNLFGQPIMGGGNIRPDAAKHVSAYPDDEYKKYVVNTSGVRPEVVERIDDRSDTQRHDHTPQQFQRSVIRKPNEGRTATETPEEYASRLRSLHSEDPTNDDPKAEEYYYAAAPSERLIRKPILAAKQSASASLLIDDWILLAVSIALAISIAAWL